MANFHWDAFDLVVIDESHNFRNVSKVSRDESGDIIRKGRYQHLVDKVLSHNPNMKVLMLSATPVNTAITDIKNQIDLFTHKNDGAFAKTLGIANYGALINDTQRKFKKWEKEYNIKNKQNLLAEFHPSFTRLPETVYTASPTRCRRNSHVYSLRTSAAFGDEELTAAAPPRQLRREQTWLLRARQRSRG